MNQHAINVINYQLDEAIAQDRAELEVSRRFDTMDQDTRLQWINHLEDCISAKEDMDQHADFIVCMLNYAITEQEDRLRYEHYPTLADKLAASQELIDLEAAKNLMLSKKKAVAC